MVEIKVKKLEGIHKAVGLILAKRPYPIFFKTLFCIHTFGLRFPIDILILDKNNIVARLKKSFKPNRFFVWPFDYENVVELPEGEIEKLDIKIGQEINLKYI